MKADDELLSEFESRVSSFFTYTTDMRKEASMMYRFRDCHQVETKGQEAEYKPLNNLPMSRTSDRVLAVANLSAPYVRAIAGMFLSNNKQTQAYGVDPTFDGEIDVMSDSVEWAQYISGYRHARTLAYEDALVCGVGATCTHLDFSNKHMICGMPKVQRKFPLFVFYDRSGRAESLNESAQWCGYADPVYGEKLDEYIAMMRPELKDVGGSGLFNPDLLAYIQPEDEAVVDFLYHYYWYEWTDVYDAENPYVTRREELVPLAQEDPDVLNALGEMSESLQVDMRSSYWSLDADNLKELNATIDNINALTGAKLEPVEYSTRKARCYYHAEIARGHVLKKSPSFTQRGHAMNFMTAYFDETKGYHYGLMRPLALVQEPLNEALSDFSTYAKRSATGGNTAISGAGDELKRIIQNKIHENQAFPVPEGTQITNLGTPDAAQAMLGLVNLYVELMSKVIGLPPEFLGQLTTGDMTNALFGKLQKQMNAVLAHVANNSDSALMAQGYVFIDLVKTMAETQDGIVLPMISPSANGEDFFYFSKQNMAKEYSLRIVERASSYDDMQDNFDKWAALFPSLQPPQQAALLPMLIETSNFDDDVKEEALQRLQPPPAQPDPLAIEERKGAIRLMNAQSAKDEANALKTQQESEYVPDDMLAVIEKNIAQAAKYNNEARVI